MPRWLPKSENVAEILREANLLARNALFIDDNPAERQNILDANPGIRVLGGDLYSIRRVLLWAPETQVISVSQESARRTEMIQAQVERERSREAMPREAFLASLEVRLNRVVIDHDAHPRFAPAFELINKSNQFNTTGERWSAEEARRLFASGGRFEGFEVADKFTEYGLVGVAIVEADTIRQYVMSCRVLGLDVEQAFVSSVAMELVERHGLARGRVLETDANILARDLFQKAGFHWDGITWVGHAETILDRPQHVAGLDSRAWRAKSIAH